MPPTPDAIRNEADWRRLCDYMLEVCGLGFHPDTDAVDYVNVETVARTFSPAVAKRLQRLLAQARNAIPEDAYWEIAWAAHEECYPEFGAAERRKGT